MRAGLLLELYSRRSVTQLLNRQLREIADSQEPRGLLAAGPGEFAGRKNGAVWADFDDGVFLVHRQHEAGDVTSLFDGVAPVVIFISVELPEIVADHIRQIAPPAVAAFVGVQAVA